jgi:lysine-N-methylase
MKPAKLLRPGYFDRFRCIGAECEDTCCVGWLVHVDKRSYEKYQSCADPECGSSLRTLITINEKSANDDDYAKILFNQAGCPFLSEGLCSIQRRLGEEYLSNMCATYPRVMNWVDDVLHQSLDLSCPEAARVVLLNPLPMNFDEQEYTDGSLRLAGFPSLDTSSLKDSTERYHFFRDIRRFAISLLQDRSHPTWKRLFMVGCLCEKLEEAGSLGGDRNALNIIQDYINDLDNGMLNDALTKCSAQPTVQLEVVLELIVARISSEFNPRSFLDCYKQFMDGIQWTTASTMDEIGARYAEAYAQYYVSFMSQHEHILEHYLVNYVHRTLFPFGLQERNQRLFNERVPSPIAAQYMLMIALYAITQTLLIGLAGFHKTAFGFDQVIKLIQSCTKTFEHSVTYPGRVIQMLADKSMTTPTSLCVLIQT